MLERRASLLDRLRGFQGLYVPARFLYRIGRRAFWGLLRLIMPRWSRFGPAKGVFSALDLVQRKVVPGRFILPAEPLGPVAHDSLRSRAGLLQDVGGSWPVFWSLHSNARLVGETLTLQDDSKRVCAEAAYAPWCLPNDPAYNFWRLPKPVRLTGNWTSIISRWTVEPNYYHWFLDALPRLSLLSEFPNDTGILVPPHLAQYQTDSLNWLGVLGKVRPTTEHHLAVDEYYFSAPSAMTGWHNPYAVKFLRHAFLSRADATYDSPKRFFLHRIGTTRGIQNEKEVLEFFGTLGWAIVDAAQLSLAQQIRLFANAEIICALHGGGLANLVWSKPGCRVIELLAHNYLNGVYEGLASMLGLIYRFLVFPGDSSFRARIEIPRVREVIAECMRDMSAGRG